MVFENVDRVLRLQPQLKRKALKGSRQRSARLQLSLLYGRDLEYTRISRRQKELAETCFERTLVVEVEPSLRRSDISRKTLHGPVIDVRA